MIVSKNSGTKKCKNPNCKDRFVPMNNNSLQKYCLKKEECRKLGYADLIEKQRKQDEKITKQRNKDLKESVRPIGEWKQLLQDEINLIARLLDKGHPCMMCGNPRMKKINGCHYHSVGSNASLRYNLLNIWHGCHSCNSEKGGNIIGYDTCLIATFGEEFWNEVKFDLVRENKRIDLRLPDYKEKIEIAREIVRELKKADKIYDTYERVEMRDKFNKRIKIYE